ncbi:MAG: type II secretion system F family protein [Alphaproteobacteria bacterium]|nr:type II secretion system F family protein [Alphaproteobacteria bacterium]
MPKFSYRAINERGRPVRGVVNAANEADLFARLQETGMSLLDCKEMNDKASKLAALTAKKVAIRDLIQMFVHLEQLQKAGVPLLDALSDVRDTAESTRLRDIMSDVYEEVSAGSSFSNALGKHPGTFEPIFISLINAGEETGNMTNSFTQVIKHLKWTDAMRSKVKKATRYPKILLGVVILVIWIMMTQVVPQVVGFLKDIGSELPGVTIALINTSNFIQDYALYIFAGLIAFVVGMRVGRNVSEGFRYQTDYMFLRMPAMGPMIRKISLSRFCQTFAVLFSSGLEILKCLEAAKLTAGNLVLTEALERVKQNVQEGSPLSVALNNSGEFPSLVVRMVRIGEESGQLTGVLEQVTEFYDKDVNDAVDGMIAMIEPAMTVVLGGMILWIAAAVFGPIYDSIGKMGQ